MFLEQTIKRNPQLINASFTLHQQQSILPDTYVVDIDTFIENAKHMLHKANDNQIELYFMLKQIGRNPYIAQKLIDIGYKGAVVVDFKEAQVMMKHHIPISNVGHLVQPPHALLHELISYGCKYFTVFSVEKAKEINDIARTLNMKQKVLLKVIDEGDVIYEGQTAGFELEKLDETIKVLKTLDAIEIAGLTSFPCFLYNEEKDSITQTHNLETVLKAKELLQEQGISIDNINAPSATCSYTLDAMKALAITSGEPGHGLSGTTPLHAIKKCVEKPCVTYVSEISHNYKDMSYCYGGGYYRRSHVSHCLVGKDFESSKKDEIIVPSLESIDYYFGINHNHSINETVVMAFRFQMFVTRSHVAIVEGIQKNKPHIIGIYTSLGESIHE